MKHLRSIAEIGIEGVLRLLELTDTMVESQPAAQSPVPALRGKTVCNLFFEDSTRTRLSFETAAKRLSADVMTFTVGTSSVNKGESLRDTIETIAAMGVDAFVIRHGSSGVPWQVSRWTTASIINAGDGWHGHPTQALLDAYTVRSGARAHGRARRRAGRHRRRHPPQPCGPQRRRGVHGARRRRHARGARDAAAAGSAGAGDGRPRRGASRRSTCCTCCGCNESGCSEALVPSLREYSARFGLTAERARRLPEHALVMHPGPMNRGVEILVDPAELPGAVITQQVTNGVAVRMAVLFELLGAGRDVPRSGAMSTVDPRRDGRRSRWERRADVLIEDGRVAAVGDESSPTADRPVLDADGCVVAPGFVDLHAHLREPGREEAETIETGSRAAALGGFTAVVAMPNTDPPQDSRGVVEFVRAPGRAGRAVRGAAGGLHHDGPGRRVAGPVRRAGRRRRAASSPTTATACRIRC